MNNENNNNIGILVFVGICILVVLLLVSTFSGNGSSTKSQSNYEKSLYDAYDKKKNGETLTKEEQRAWDDYKEWERKNY